ncbi:MAG TPA: phosphoglycerate kinase [Verrucomicrobiae bacterium]|jgi:phosphoglycerate kinase|nr:phosphoglycerate kinase [Verrucomicrobiae bacterium]
MIRDVKELDLTGKRVFVRADFNVPIQNGRITEVHRIESTLPTLRYILGKAGKLIVASHLGRPGGKKNPEYSLAPVRDALEKLLGQPVALAPDSVGAEVEALVRDSSRNIILLENLRFHKEEEKNDPEFSKQLAALAEVYVNDAFGTAHRAHASTAGMVKFIPEKGAGLLLKKELEYLGKLLGHPEHPFAAILGGAKVSDKIGVITNLMPKIDSLLIGGGMAYTFLKAQGFSIGRSLLEADRVELARELEAKAKAAGVALVLPTDHVAAEGRDKAPVTVGENIPEKLIGLDIGPKTIERFAREIKKSKMVLWNGPVGLFEEEKFRAGTQAIANAVANSGAVSVVAGGDTVAAVDQAGVGSRITHLSTGGGATLEFLEGKKLPGIEALEVQP